MEEEILCKSCICWVDCGEKKGKAHGFCLCRDLFTHTAETECRDYLKGKPSTEEEWENFQKG